MSARPRPPLDHPCMLCAVAPCDCANVRDLDRAYEDCLMCSTCGEVEGQDTNPAEQEEDF